LLSDGGSTTCSGVDEYSLNLREPCNLNINPSIGCTTRTLDVLGSEEVSCLDYISGIDDFTDPSQCMREVKYEITLINQGLSCIDIESATCRLEGSNPVDITLEGSNVSVCPDKNIDVVHFTEQNMCDDDLDSAIIVEVNGEPAESCGGFGTLNNLPVPKSTEDSQVELSLSCSDQYGNECVVAHDQQECDSHPTYLDVKFTGKPCNASANDLGPLFTCNDLDSMQDVSEAYITIESKEDGVYFEAPVTKGKMVRLGDEFRKLPADLVLNIQASRNGSLLQKMKFRASCTEPISTRNVIGSLTLLGFGDDGEKPVVHVATENEFEIQYEINNVGETTVLLEGMLISVNDEQISRVSIGGLYQLPAGATYRGSETVEINASTTDVKAVTVVGDLIAASLSAIKSNTQDRMKMKTKAPKSSKAPGKGSSKAPGKGSSKAPKAPKAAKRGRKSTRGVWVSGGHEDGCTFGSVANSFWSNEVCSTVFPRCDNNYESIPDMIKECKDGARAFGEEIIRECFDEVVECQDLGERASMSVASIYCNKDYDGRDPSLLPEFCVTNTIDHCRANFLSDINAYVDGVGCDRDWPLSDKDQSKYREKCEMEVKKMAKFTSLPDC
jgi:hypothetical protein